MQSLAAECLRSIAQSLSPELDELRDSKAGGGHKATATKAAECAVSLSRLVTLIRASCSLQLPKDSISVDRAVMVNSYYPDEATLVVPSTKPREALRLARKRLRGEDGQASEAMPALRSVTLVEGLQGLLDTSSGAPGPRFSNSQPTLGLAAREVANVQGAERSALLRYGRVALLPTPTQPTPAAAAKYEGLVRAADSLLAGEYLSLLTKARLTELQITAQPAHGAATLLHIRNGVACLSVRGLCILNVRFVEPTRKWELVSFIWTVFDLTGANRADKPPVLSLAHIAHTQIVKRVALEVSNGLEKGVQAASRCCAGAVLQHIHNRLMVATQGNTIPLLLDGHLCKFKSDATQRSASIVLYCTPTEVGQQPMTLKYYFDPSTCAFLKSRQVGTDVDGEVRQMALKVFPIGQMPSEDLSMAVRRHLLDSMARLAGIAGSVSESEYEQHLPSMDCATVAALDMTQLASVSV